MRRNTRKPRLNQELNRCRKSRSTMASDGFRFTSCSRSARIATSAAVPPGAPQIRLNSS